jgi:23S rRNA (uracil1939-C5)-methyltransferase
MEKIIENILITDVADEGRGLGRYEGKVVFVDHAVPGDVVNVNVRRKKNKFVEGSIESVISFSEHRVEPPCTHFGVCGGCKWQNMNYEKQLFFKQKLVTDALTRIGMLVDPEIIPIKKSAAIYHYRNRLDFAFAKREWMTQEQMHDETFKALPALGFHVPGKFDKILNIQNCYLQDDLSNKIRNFVRDYSIKNDLSFFEHREQVGFLRSLIIRNTTKGEWMVIVMFKDDDEQKRNQLLEAIAKEFPDITSLLYIINTKRNDTFFDLDFHVFKGQDFITEEMEGLQFRIGPKSFYQTNPSQAYELYKITREFAEFKGTETVYDLYTGTGTIANFIASQVKKVIGVESVEEAVKHAKFNSDLNGITNTSFYAGDMKDILTDDFFKIHGFPDVIITDPPRAGMHADVVKAISNSGAQRIVYVSCNAATQARDIAMMRDHYRFIKAMPVDMFPHTQHVENVAMLEKI